MVTSVNLGKCSLILEYPQGTTVIDGDQISNMKLAQQILVGLRAGADVVIPQGVDAFGRDLWRLKVWNGQSLTECTNGAKEPVEGSDFLGRETYSSR